VDRALSAPGKLFLSGEYAVLWGGTARVAAVGPRVSAYVRRRMDREVVIALEAGRLAGRATPAGVSWVGPVPEPFVFAARALDEVFRVQAKEALGLELALSPSPSAAGGQKLGMGGSARASVLATEAGRFVLEAKADALKLALLAHASAQGGTGSGADVAACFAGGVIRYRRYSTEPLSVASREGRLGAALAQSEPVEVFRLPAPKLAMLFAYTGQAASTTVQVREIEQRLVGEKRARFAARAEEWGNAFEDALLKSDLPGLVEACDELQAGLASLGPLETEATRRILALAKSHGAAAKISGAGGGDGCVAFCADEGARAELAAALTARGFLAQAVELEAGLRGEKAAEPALARWLDVAA